MKKFITILALVIGMMALTSCGSKVSTVENKSITLNLSFGNMEGIYSGDLVDGLPEGNGRFETTNVAGKNWYYEGEFKAGHFEGQGKTVWVSGQTQEGNYVNDIWIPNPYQFFLFTSSLADANFTINELAAKLLQEKPDLFPNTSVDALTDFVDESLDYKTVIENTVKYGDKLMKLSNLMITREDSFAISDNPDSLDSLRCTYLILIDSEENFYELYYQGDLGNLKVGDTLTEVYGLPIGNGSFDVVPGNPTSSIILAGSHVTK